VKYSPEEILYYQSDKSPYSVAKKEATDKYYIFIQRAISLLNETGFLGYIIPHKFFLIKAGKNLRKFIVENSQLSKIIHFGVNQVFPGKLTYTAILVLQKSPSDYFSFKKSISKSLDTVAIQEYIEYRTDLYNSDPWIFLSPSTNAVFKKLYVNPFNKLGDVADICVGLQTSADPIYIFRLDSETEDTYKFVRGGQEYEIEKAVCLPCLYDVSFTVFDTVSSNAMIIFPYSISGGKAELFTEEYLEENFPLCWAYFNHHKTALQKRNLNGKDPKWYQFGRSQSLTRFHDTPKLIWSVLSTKAPYGIDIQNIQFTGGGNGPYYSLIPTSEYELEFIMGVLSHPVIEAMVKSGASEFQGAYYSHGKQFLESIPIPVINESNLFLYEAINNIVKALINTKSQIKAEPLKRKILIRKFNLLEEDLILHVNQLYGISDEDLRTVLTDELLISELNTDQ
jgi:hypothetical protein